MDLNELKCRGCNHPESKHKGTTKYCTHISNENKMCKCAYFR